MMFLVVIQQKLHLWMTEGPAGFINGKGIQQMLQIILLIGEQVWCIIFTHAKFDGAQCLIIIFFQIQDILKTVTETGIQTIFYTKFLQCFVVFFRDQLMRRHGNDDNQLSVVYNGL